MRILGQQPVARAHGKVAGGRQGRAHRHERSLVPAIASVRGTACTGLPPSTASNDCHEPIRKPVHDMPRLCALQHGNGSDNSPNATKQQVINLRLCGSVVPTLVNPNHPTAEGPTLRIKPGGPAQGDTEGGSCGFGGYWLSALLAHLHLNASSAASVSGRSGVCRARRRARSVRVRPAC